jgi:hypothetical protein
LYRTGPWEIARKFAEELKQCWHGELDNYYDMMIDRITDLKNLNTPNWDGVYRATSK